MDNKTNKSKKQRRKERKKSDKEFLDKYKGQAPKGPGFTWVGKSIYALVFIIFVLGFTFGKSIYIGGTPMKLIDYSLTQSLNTNGRDINLLIDVEKENPGESYSSETNLLYTFEYLTSVAKINHSNYDPVDIYFTTDKLSFRKNDKNWNQYDLENVNINGLENIDWGLFHSVIDVRSIPEIKDILKETVQFFTTSFYKRFTFGENIDIQTKSETYDCKQINLTFSSDEYYHLLSDFIEYNDNNINIRNAIKDRVKRFLTVVDDNELYDSFNLDKDTVELYLEDLDYNFEITYYVLVDYITLLLEQLENTLSDTDSEVTLSFYVDKKYNVRSLDAVYTDFDPSNDLKSTRVYYVVNDFTHSYVESPLGAEKTDDMGSKPQVDLNELTKDTNNLVIKNLMKLYNNVFNK